MPSAALAMTKTKLFVLAKKRTRTKLFRQRRLIGEKICHGVHMPCVRTPKFHGAKKTSDGRHLLRLIERFFSPQSQDGILGALKAFSLSFMLAVCQYGGCVTIPSTLRRPISQRVSIENSSPTSKYRYPARCASVSSSILHPQMVLFRSTCT